MNSSTSVQFIYILDKIFKKRVYIWYVRNGSDWSYLAFLFLRLILTNNTFLETIKILLSTTKLALCIVQSRAVKIDAFKPREVERDLDVCVKEKREEREWEKGKWIFLERASIRALSTQPSRLPIYYWRGVAFRPRKDVKSLSKVTMRRGARCDDDKQRFKERERETRGLAVVFSKSLINITSNRERLFLSLLRELHIPTGEEPMIAGNCFSTVAYLSLRFTQQPQRYAPRRLYLLLKRIPYKTRTKFNFFHGPKYIRFVSPRSFSLFPSRSPRSPSLSRAFNAISPGSY